MTNDDRGDQDLRATFQSLAARDKATMMDFERFLSTRPANSRVAPGTSGARSRGRGVALVAASVTSLLVALGAGLVWGANTGYAAARRAGDAQRDEMVAATADAKSQLAALRVTLRRMRADLVRRSAADPDAALSIMSVEAELRSMETSAQRIEDNFTNKGAAAAAIPPMQLTGLPVKRALAITIRALSAPSSPPPTLHQGIPVVDLAPATATTTEVFGGILGVRQSTDGSLLVNDAARRQIKRLDPSLKTSTIVIDSTPGTSASYGPFAVPLIPYLGDSSLLGERNTRTMLVLDGRGKIVRALALPKANDFLSINSGPSSTDAQGRIIYRAFRSFDKSFPAPDARGSRDSILILRADLDFRRIDTIGKVARPIMKLVTQPSDGRTAYVFAPDPLQPVDEWAVTSNGAVAFIRGHDYHVDWIQPDGSPATTPKLQFDWKRLTDDEKQRLADSVRSGQNALLSSGYPQAEYAIRVPCERSALPPAPGTGRGGGSGAPPPDAMRDDSCISVIQTSGIPLVAGTPARAMEPLPPLADLLRGGPIEDYLAPIAPSATLADQDGNLWILPRMSSLSRSGELVYDVVSAQGKLFQRVRLPVGRSIAGFGKGGVVYLQSGSRATGFRLERTTMTK